jgi:hypothetical protein
VAAEITGAGTLLPSTAIGGITNAAVTKPAATTGRYCFTALAPKVVTATALSIGDVASVSQDPAAVASNCPGVTAPVFVVVIQKLVGGLDDASFAIQIDY